MNLAPKKQPRSPVLPALRIAAASALAGWGLMHLFWDVPYRSLLWDETLLKSFVEGTLGIDWSEWVTGERIDAMINDGRRLIGVGLLLSALLAALPSRGRLAALTRAVLPMASLALLGVALLLFKDGGLRVGLLVEYASQFASPFLLWLALRSARSASLSLALRACVAATFFGHGLFAIGFYPVPGGFIDMTISVLGTNEPQARMLLEFAGILDLTVAVLVFLPRFAPFALGYAAAWGLLTTLARPVNALFITDGASAMAYGLVEALYRVPHALLPVIAVYMLWERRAHDPAHVVNDPSSSRRRTRLPAQ